MDKISVILLAHMMADYAFQSDFMAQFKSKNWFILLVHCVTYALIKGVAFQYLGVYALWKVLLTFGVHVITDEWKGCAGKKKPEEALRLYLYIDQSIHIALGFLLVCV